METIVSFSSSNATNIPHWTFKYLRRLAVSCRLAARSRSRESFQRNYLLPWAIELVNVSPLYIADIDIHILVFPKGFSYLHCHQPPLLRCKLHFLSCALPSVHTTLTHQRETACLLNYSYLCMRYFIQYLFVLCVCCPSLVWLCNGQLLSLTKLRSLFFPEHKPGVSAWAIFTEISKSVWGRGALQMQSKGFYLLLMST